jgi:hypothetical protein
VAVDHLVKVLRRACAAIKTGRKVTPHGFRHTLNDLLRRDARAEVTRAIIGHSTERMTHHHSHVDEEESARRWPESSRWSGAEKGWKKGWRQRTSSIDRAIRKRKTLPFGRVDPGGATRI